MILVRLMINVHYMFYLYGTNRYAQPNTGTSTVGTGTAPELYVYIWTGMPSCTVLLY